MFPELPASFQEAADLSKPFALEARTEQPRQVRSANHGAAGFPCADCLTLNGNSRTLENKCYVLNGNVNAGSVFRHVVNWFGTHGEDLIFGILENVLALARSPKQGG